MDTIKLDLFLGLLGFIVGIFGIIIGLHLHFRGKLNERDFNALVIIFNNQITKQIIKLLIENQTRYNAEFCKKMNCSRTSITKNLSFLEINKIIISEPEVIRSRKIVRMYRLNKEYNNLFGRIQKYL